MEGTAVRVTDAAALRTPAGEWSATWATDGRSDVRGEEPVGLSDSGASTGAGAWACRVAPAGVIASGDGCARTTPRS